MRQGRRPGKWASLGVGQHGWEPGSWRGGGGTRAIHGTVTSLGGLCFQVARGEWMCLMHPIRACSASLWGISSHSAATGVVADQKERELAWAKLGLGAPAPPSRGCDAVTYEVNTQYQQPEPSDPTALTDSIWRVQPSKAVSGKPAEDPTLADSESICHAHGHQRGITLSVPCP